MKNWIDQINQTETSTSKRFENWQSKNKSLIINVLNDICKEEDALYAYVNESIVNHESVILAYKTKPSNFRYKDEDLFNKQENLKGLILETGGYLSFSVTIMGNIMVWMKFPEIVNIMKNKEDYCDLGFIPQEELKKEKILEMVNNFLEKIAIWKQGKLFEREPIGFRNTK